MQINEIISEGRVTEAPLGGLKQIGAGLAGLKGGGITGAKAGWNAQGAANAQSNKINKEVAAAHQKWAAIAQNIKMSGSEVTPAAAKKWFKQFSGSNPTTMPPSTSNIDIDKWLRTEIANKTAKQSMSTGTPRKARTASSTPTAAQPAIDINKMSREELTKLHQELTGGAKKAAPTVTQPVAQPSTDRQPTATTPSATAPSRIRPAATPITVRNGQGEWSLSDADGNWRINGTDTVADAATASKLNTAASEQINFRKQQGMHLANPDAQTATQPTSGRQLSQTPNAIRKRAKRATQVAPPTHVNKSVGVK